MAGISKKRVVQFAVLAVMAGEVSYAAAQVLVLRSNGPSARRYPAGQRLPDNASFALRPGDTVVILTTGGTRTLRGPGTCTATGQGCTGRLAAGNVRVGTGAVRGPGEAETVPQPQDVWQVDVAQSGRACVAAGGTPVLWRANARDAVQLTITPQVGTVRTIAWPAGQATLAWPATLPVADGASYQLAWTGGAAPTRLTTRVLPPVPAGDSGALATALLAGQCHAQLTTWIARNELRGGAPDGTRGAQ